MNDELLTMPCECCGDTLCIMCGEDWCPDEDGCCSICFMEDSDEDDD